MKQHQRSNVSDMDREMVQVPTSMHVIGLTMNKHSSVSLSCWETRKLEFSFSEDISTFGNRCDVRARSGWATTVFVVLQQMSLESRHVCLIACWTDLSRSCSLAAACWDSWRSFLVLRNLPPDPLGLLRAWTCRDSWRYGCCSKKSKYEHSFLNEKLLLVLIIIPSGLWLVCFEPQAWHVAAFSSW